MRKILVALMLLFAAGVCFAQTHKVKQKDLAKLAAMMAGEFSSEKQSLADPAFLHIKLRMMPIWTERSDGFWLYVEQAAAETEDKPYRQRVYRLYRQDDMTIVSKVYEIRDSDQFVGAWKDPEKLKNLLAGSLIERRGCSILLTKTGKGSFGGSTPGKECVSSLRGASYATSEVTVFKNKLVSWDRGWDEHGKQVWGAVKGGYVFEKLRGFYKDL